MAVTAQVNHCATECGLPRALGLFKVDRCALKRAPETDIERHIAEVLVHIELDVLAELVLDQEGVVLVQLTGRHLREECAGEGSNVAQHQEVHHVAEGLGHVIEYQAVVVHRVGPLNRSTALLVVLRLGQQLSARSQSESLPH